MNHYQVLANCPEEQVCRLAEMVLQKYSGSDVKLLSGPRCGLVMLRVRETVANSLFNAGEILVTEVKLELDGQFGFGMVIGDSPRRAMAVALVDAALRKDEEATSLLHGELAQLAHELQQEHQRAYQLAATTKVDFEVI